MVVAGLPERTGSLHAKEIADLSLTIRESVRSFQIGHLPNEQLKIRIGAHSGKQKIISIPSTYFFPRDLMDGYLTPTYSN